MDPRIQLVVSTIEREFSNKLSTETLGHLVNMSASRLRHLFKAETGLTVSQYLKQIRMRRAEVLLQTTFLSVKQIMNLVGVHDDAYFSREFRKLYGAAPGQYRKLFDRE